MLFERIIPGGRDLPDVSRRGAAKKTHVNQEVLPSVQNKQRNIPKFCATTQDKPARKVVLLDLMARVDLDLCP